MISPATDLALQAIAKQAAADPEAYCETVYRLAELMHEQAARMSPFGNAAGIGANALQGAVRAYAFWVDTLGQELPFDPEQEAA